MVKRINNRCRGSSVAEQLIRNQQVVGSTPTPGSTILFLLILLGSLFYTKPLFSEIDGTYQRVYNSAAILRVTPEFNIPNSLTINLAGGFSFSRRLIAELIIGAGDSKYINNGYYFATRMIYKILIARGNLPAINLIVGANNRNKLGFDMGFSISKYFNNFAVYFGFLDKNSFGFNLNNSSFIATPGVEIPISRQLFFNMESGWDIKSSSAFISSGITITIY